MNTQYVVALMGAALEADSSIETGRTRRWNGKLLVEVDCADDAHETVERARDLVIAAVREDEIPGTGPITPLPGGTRFRLELTPESEEPYAVYLGFVWALHNQKQHGEKEAEQWRVWPESTRTGRVFAVDFQLVNPADPTKTAYLT